MGQVHFKVLYNMEVLHNDQVLQETQWRRHPPCITGPG